MQLDLWGNPDTLLIYKEPASSGWETGERRTRTGYYFPCESMGGMYLFSFVSYHVFGHAGEVPALLK